MGMRFQRGRRMKKLTEKEIADQEAYAAQQEALGVDVSQQSFGEMEETAARKRSLRAEKEAVQNDADMDDVDREIRLAELEAEEQYLVGGDAGRSGQTLDPNGPVGPRPKRG